MIETGKSQLRERPYQGRMFKLNNAESFLVPSLPIGPTGEIFFDYLERLDKVNFASREGSRYLHELFTKAIQLNYPALTPEDTDGLFSMSHFRELFGWFFGVELSGQGNPPPPAAPSAPAGPAT